MESLMPHKVNLETFLAHLNNLLNDLHVSFLESRLDVYLPLVEVCLLNPVNELSQRHDHAPADVAHPTIGRFGLPGWLLIR